MGTGRFRSGSTSLDEVDDTADYGTTIHTNPNPYRTGAENTRTFLLRIVGDSSICCTNYAGLPKMSSVHTATYVMKRLRA